MSGSRLERRKINKASARSTVFRYIAIALIVAGVGVLGYVGLEWFTVYYRQARLQQEYEASAGFGRLVEEDQEVVLTEWEPMRLIIPAIDVDLIVLADVDVYDKDELGNEPWNFGSSDYHHWINSLKPLLDEAPVYYQLSDLPSTESGNVVIAGHRAGRWNFFLDLDLLEPGDEIYLDISGYRFIYHVDHLAEVGKYDWTMFYTTEDPSITLQTCTPKHMPNPPLRLNARGVLYDVEPLPLETPYVN